MLCARRLSGFAVLSLLTTCYWLALTVYLWLPDLLPSSPLVVFVFLGGGLLFAASLLLPPVAVLVEFALDPRKRPCFTAGPPSAFDRVRASVSLALVVVLTAYVPFAIGFVSGLLGMRQAGRSRRTVRGYALAGSCSLASFLAALVFLAGIVQQAKTHGRAVMAWSQCKDNVIQLAAAWKAQGGSWDAREWCDEVDRYLSSKAVLVCPAAPELDCGYALNAALSGLPYGAIENSRHTVAIFESDAGWNAAGGPELLPDDPRHFGDDDYVFADGHVEWLPRRKLGTDKHGKPIWAKEPDADWVIWEPVLKKPEEQPQ